MPRADLHLHTYHSDGLHSPTEVVEKAHARGLDTIAITDHDTVAGLAEALEAGRRLGVHVLAGVELSVTVGTDEVHLLGYRFDPHDPSLLAHMEHFREVRARRAREIVARLTRLGVDVSFEEVQEQAGRGVIGRPHVARVLLQKGVVETVQEAFDRFLGDSGAAYVQKDAFPAAEALGLLHAAGGLGVVAHPGVNVKDDTFDALVRAGMDGVEVVHPAHGFVSQRFYRQEARRYGLLLTGGSDYHGTKPSDEFNFGRYTVPVASLDFLRSAA